jgi:hypothetical protein
MQSDRFAHEIIAILALSYAARSRRLMRSPLGCRALLLYPNVVAEVILT